MGAGAAANRSELKGAVDPVCDKDGLHLVQQTRAASACGDWGRLVAAEAAAPPEGEARTGSRRAGRVAGPVAAAAGLRAEAAVACDSKVALIS